ncbi:NAD(P)-binding domain-containing protein [Curvivirga aplysinae]|uniref:NAD(P)-binding domain-containing protein n=1 Tax=Curvivirga aplysinae TaxID=2529852 RepID=UPI0012BB8C01|nr:NAD(P)-binding domain-containing protein [Curvivirga aplysinae]MTI08996.1 pyrroline-5-carboxylate reductase [Curvivirga aplysinae]
MTLGIIGVGHLASYLVAGIRRSGDQRRIVLSPRNKDVAAKIAANFNCEIAKDNQSVVNEADIVLLATRPVHALMALQEVAFREGQIMLSAVAGVCVNDITPYAKPAEVVRCLPLAPAEVCAGATPIFPDNAAVQELLDPVVTVIPVEDEEEFELGSVFGCIGGWVYTLIGQLQNWLEKQGMPSEQARSLAIETFHGATSLAKEQPTMDLLEQANLIATEGTFTKFFQDTFEDKGGMKALFESSDALSERLKL